MYSPQILVALFVLLLAVAIPLITVAVRVAQLLRWAFHADPATRGERPRFTGPVLALLFSVLAASDFTSYEPMRTIAELNPVPMAARAYFTVAMLVLAVLSWAYGGAVKDRLLRRLGSAKA
ncbi:hypothetical protein [Achromobacter marplatensis]|uniref:hypothetical protein n=1 Tax=Achromobacter marplatensis TaxID=470868 RepID=UPI0039F6D991